MSEFFDRTGPLQEAGSYPQWAQQLIVDCQASKDRVSGHELYRRMRDAELSPALRRYTEAAIARIRISPEGQEGLRAFLDKRKPAWQEQV